MDYAVAGATGSAAALPAEGPLRFAVIGDSGSGSPAQWDVAARLAQAAPHFVLHTGDIVYPRGGLEDYGPRYFAPYKETLSRAPRSGPALRLRLGGRQLPWLRAGREPPAPGPLDGAPRRDAVATPVGPGAANGLRRSCVVTAQTSYQ